MSFPAYPDYQDSGIAWVGKMPVHWGVKQLKWLFDLQKRPVRDEDEIVTAFRDGIVTLRKNRREEGFTNSLKEIGYQGIRKGDLVIHAMDGFAGAIGVSDSDGKSTPVYSVCKPKEGSLSEYFGRLLRYMALSGFVDSLAKGVRERSTEFRWRDASVLPLPVPPVHEQRAIVHFLDRETAKIDALVAEQERLIALLKEKRQAVISHAVTKGLAPDAPMKDSGIEWLGEIPAHWDAMKLGRAAFMQEGPGLRTWQFTTEGVRVICVTNITDAGIDFSRLEKFISEDEYEATYQHFTVGHGDVLLSSSGNSWGKVAVYDDDESVILNTSTIRLHELEDIRLCNGFLPFVLQSDPVRDQLDLAMTGACQPNFGPTHLNAVMVAVPPNDDQLEIVRHLESACGRLQALISKAEAAVVLLKERRAALISAAVTGKIDVRGLVDQHELEAT